MHYIYIQIATSTVSVDSRNCPYDGDLTAVKSWRITIFNQSLPVPHNDVFQGDTDGAECQWQIEADEDDHIVRLRFPTFHLKNSTGDNTEDCVFIYDGSGDTDTLIQKLCDRMPETVYNSTGQNLTVVFQQGSQGGWRWMTLNYTMEAPAIDERNVFWSTTVGRILSFGIVIVIFGFFSYFFRACREGSGRGSCLGDMCQRLGEMVACCLKAVRDCWNRCTSLFKPRLPPGTSNSVAANVSVSRSADADIVTISAAGDSVSTHRSALSSSGTESSAETELQAPPSYSSIFSTPPAYDAGGDGAAASAPSTTYSPARSSALQPGGASPPPPPPVDNAAPPSYELPEPPSYDSLFENGSRA
ncbi:hypothetical protein V1264_009119 [Littorina saxatilis]|uniref:CUB domain-containing protein n=1 Tax=Littorina saxatilis TaxID=31220 RepID=A0AAN9AR06_9CAEN